MAPRTRKGISSGFTDHFISDVLFALRDAEHEDLQSGHDTKILLSASQGAGIPRRYIETSVSHVEKTVLEAIDGRNAFWEMADLWMAERIRVVLEAARELNRYAGEGNAASPYRSALETLCVLVRHALPDPDLLPGERRILLQHMAAVHELIDSQLRRKATQPDDLYSRINPNAFLLANVDPQAALYLSSLNAYNKDWTEYTEMNVMRIRLLFEKEGMKGLLAQIHVPFEPLWVTAQIINHDGPAMDTLFQVHTNLSEELEKKVSGFWFYTHLRTAMHMPEDNPLTGKIWLAMTTLYEKYICSGQDDDARDMMDGVLENLVGSSNPSPEALSKNRRIEAFIEHCLDYADRHRSQVAAQPVHPAGRSAHTSSITALLSSTALSGSIAPQLTEQLRLQ